MSKRGIGFYWLRFCMKSARFSARSGDSSRGGKPRWPRPRNVGLYSVPLQSSGESCSLLAKAANQESVAPVGTPTTVGATASHFLSIKLFEYIYIYICVCVYYIHIYPQCYPTHLLLLIFDSMRSSMASLPNLPTCLVLPRATQVLGSA